MSVIGASNEYPEEGLEALFDRFLLRFEVEYIADDTNFVSMMKNVGPTITMKDLIHFQFLTDMVVIQEEVYSAITKIRKEFRDEGIRPSDRRFKQWLSTSAAGGFVAEDKSCW